MDPNEAHINCNSNGRRVDPELQLLYFYFSLFHLERFVSVADGNSQTVKKRLHNGYRKRYY